MVRLRQGMSRRLLIAIAPLLMAASVAFASEGSKEASKGDVGQYVDLQPVAMPIVVGGRLINYVFVNVRINLTNGANVARQREREPYFRDALVRAAHRTPFVLAADYQKVDERRLTASLMRDAAAISGPGQIRSVVVSAQATQRRPAPPKRAQNAPL